MNKSDIAGRVADRMRLSKFAAESAVDIVLEAIAEALAKEEAVRIAGFGTFATRSRSARTGRNPATGERVAIAASKAPSFKAGKALRDAVNKDWNPVASDNANDWNKEQLAQGEDAKTLDVSDWPGGLAPVWTLLEHDSARTLGAEPNAADGALRFASDLDDGELAQSVFVRNALVLLEAMGAKETMWISSSGNCLTKNCVTRLRGLISWPGLEATEHFRTGKTYREQDVWELHLLRVLVEQAGLIRPGGLWFELTPLGRAMLEPGSGARCRRCCSVMRSGTWISLASCTFIPADCRGGGRRVRSASSSGGCRQWRRIGRMRRRSPRCARSPTTRFRRRAGGRRPRCSCGGFSGRCAGSGCSSTGDWRRRWTWRGARASCSTASCRSMSGSRTAQGRNH